MAVCDTRSTRVFCCTVEGIARGTLVESCTTPLAIMSWNELSLYITSDQLPWPTCRSEGRAYGSCLKIVVTLEIANGPGSFALGYVLLGDLVTIQGRSVPSSKQWNLEVATKAQPYLYVGNHTRIEFASCMVDRKLNVSSSHDAFGSLSVVRHDEGPQQIGVCKQG